MGRIKDFLLGKEYYFIDSRLGDFKTRTRNQNLNANCTWIGDFRIWNQEKETVIIIEGNIQSPLKQHLDTVHSIINSQNEIKKKIEDEWKVSENKNGTFDEKWLTKFYLSAIVPAESENNSFEINFESKDNNVSTIISIIWEKLKMSEFEILK